MVRRRDFLRTVSSVCSGGAVLLCAKPLQAVVGCTPFNPYTGLASCEAGISSEVFTVKAYDTQHATEWCWAACIEMVFAYYGFKVPQTRIVRETWGKIINLPAVSPVQILQNLNRPWVDDDGKPFEVSGTTYGANPITAAQDLAANMPLIIGTLGHAMVLTALTYNANRFARGWVTAAVVRDPWPFQPPWVIDGKHVLTYQQWISTQFLARIRVRARKVSAQRR